MAPLPPPESQATRRASAAPRRVRLDVLLVERGLVPTREKARALVLAGAVRVDGRPARGAAEAVSRDADLAAAVDDQFVSRGGQKLEHALERFAISVTERVCLDAGASTGGFTDCLLRRGARRVYAVDVGHGQLDWRLRNDARVVVRERTNVRYLDALPELIDVAVVDVSFISLRLVLGPIGRLVRAGGPIVALVKPQFEAGRGEVGRGGVVRDPKVHRRVLLELWAWCVANGLTPRGLTASPIRGPAGNAEFPLWLGNARSVCEHPISGWSGEWDPDAATEADGPRPEAAIDAALAEVPTGMSAARRADAHAEPATRD